MKNKNLLLAAAMMFLATACKENKSVEPASEPVQIETKAPQGPVLTDDTVIEVVETPRKPNQVKPAPVDTPPKSVPPELPVKSKAQ